MKHYTADIFRMKIGDFLEFPNFKRAVINTLYTRLQKKGFGKWSLHKGKDTFKITKISLPLEEDQRSKLYEAIERKAMEMGDEREFLIHEVENMAYGGTLLRYQKEVEESYEDRDIEPYFETTLEGWEFSGTVSVWNETEITNQTIHFNS